MNKSKLAQASKIRRFAIEQAKVGPIPTDMYRSLVQACSALKCKVPHIDVEQNTSEIPKDKKPQGHMIWHDLGLNENPLYSELTVTQITELFRETQKMNENKAMEEQRNQQLELIQDAVGSATEEERTFLWYMREAVKKSEREGVLYSDERLKEEAAKLQKERKPFRMSRTLRTDRGRSVGERSWLGFVITENVKQAYVDGDLPKRLQRDDRFPSGYRLSQANKEGKGVFAKRCNVNACQRTDSAYFFNKYMNAYYCLHCASDIAKANPQDDMFDEFPL